MYPAWNATDWARICHTLQRAEDLLKHEGDALAQKYTLNADEYQLCGGRPHRDLKRSYSLYRQIKYAKRSALSYVMARKKGSSLPTVSELKEAQSLLQDLSETVSDNEDVEKLDGETEGESEDEGDEQTGDVTLTGNDDDAASLSLSPSETNSEDDKDCSPDYQVPDDEDSSDDDTLSNVSQVDAEAGSEADACVDTSEEEADEIDDDATAQHTQSHDVVSPNKKAKSTHCC